jgi:cysteine synthase
MEREGILALIGKTPLVQLKEFSTPQVEIWAKLEMFNPGGSIKDRAALYMIEDAERRGVLTRDKVVLEPTSGNTGIGLALVCCVKGYPLTVVMPETMSIERHLLIKAYGGKVILTPGEEGVDGAIEKALKMAEERLDTYFMPNQFDNPANPLAHYETTGVEILEQTKGEVTAFVAGIGTSGTLMGVGKRLKEYNPAIQIVGVEPYPKHGIQGLKGLDEARRPSIFDPSIPHAMIRVHDQDAIVTTKELAKKEAILTGISTGAALYGAIQWAREIERGKIVIIFPDSGERYLSTGLFDPQ